MAVTGWKSPSNSAQYAAPPGSGPSWTNPGNAHADDGSYTQQKSRIGVSGVGEVRVWYDFGFTSSDIPYGATIDGVEVRFDIYHDPTAKFRAQLYASGALHGSAKQSTTTYSSFTDLTAGGSSDTWGASLTDSEVRATGFGVAAQGYDFTAIGAQDLRLDHIEVRVHYTVTGTQVTPGAMSLQVATTDCVVALNADVDADAASLSVTSFSISTALDKEVRPGIVSLQAATIDCKVHLNKSIDPNTAALSLSPLSPSVTFDAGLAPGTAGLQIATLSATVANDVEIAADAGALGVSTHAASVALDSEVSSDSAPLQIAVLSPSVVLATQIAPEVVQLQLSPLATSLQRDVSLTPDAMGLSLAPQAPVVRFGVEIHPSVVALSMTPAAVTFVRNVEVLPGLMDLRAAALLADVGIAPITRTVLWDSFRSRSVVQVTRPRNHASVTASKNSVLVDSENMVLLEDADTADVQVSPSELNRVSVSGGGNAA